MKTTIAIEVDEATLAALELLSLHGGAQGTTADAARAVRYLVASAADGVRRPGAWERQWLYPAFGREFEAELERYNQWNERPKPRP